MDNVDRMYRHLVRTIRSRFPQHLSQPFAISELQQTILPYRHHRRELGLETNEDYEITLTELLSGARDYLIVDDKIREQLRAELAAANPDPSAFKQFAASMVALSPAALRSLEAGPADEFSPTPPRSIAPSLSATLLNVPVPVGAAAPVTPVESASRAPVPPPAPVPFSGVTPTTSGVRQSATATSVPGTGTITPRPGETCRACNEILPPGRPITFCPHCGQNVTTMNCLACGSELEVGWKFCPTCGRPATGR
jgi:RNA polymerase subunit RPABC4/transcription elongation factor Spt4